MKKKVHLPILVGLGGLLLLKSKGAKKPEPKEEPEDTCYRCDPIEGVPDYTCAASDEVSCATCMYGDQGGLFGALLHVGTFGATGMYCELFDVKVQPHCICSAWAPK